MDHILIVFPLLLEFPRALFLSLNFLIWYQCSALVPQTMQISTQMMPIFCISSHLLTLYKSRNSSHSEYSSNMWEDTSQSLVFATTSSKDKRLSGDPALTSRLHFLQFVVLYLLFLYFIHSSTASGGLMIFRSPCLTCFNPDTLFPIPVFATCILVKPHFSTKPFPVWFSFLIQPAAAFRLESTGISCRLISPKVQDNLCLYVGYTGNVL